MKIFIVRHAIAEDSAKGGDTQRALSEEGRRKMKEAAAGFARLDPEIDTIFSSPLVRAVQTAEILARAIRYREEVQIMEELSPGYDPEAVVRALRSWKKGGKNFVLAGHEPNCSALASYLLGKVEIDFKKGAICLIETDSAAKGEGALLWHLSPQALRLISKY